LPTFSISIRSISRPAAIVQGILDFETTQKALAPVLICPTGTPSLATVSASMAGGDIASMTPIRVLAFSADGWQPPTLVLAGGRVRP